MAKELPTRETARFNAAFRDLVKEGYFDWSMQEEGGNEVGLLANMTLEQATKEATAFARLHGKNKVFLQPIEAAIEVLAY